MDSMLVIIGFCCMLIGVIGFLPVVPGAPMSWIGLALLYFTTVIPANYWILSITLVPLSLQYYISRPEEIRRKFLWHLGTNIGLVAGLLSPIHLDFLSVLLQAL
jgi:hypothetical protein